MLDGNIRPRTERAGDGHRLLGDFFYHFLGHFAGFDARPAETADDDRTGMVMSAAGGGRTAGRRILHHPADGCAAKGALGFG